MTDEAMYLISNEIFDESDVDTKAFKFYEEYLEEGYTIFEIDRYANLNTLFGYDIGDEAAMEIDKRLYDITEEVDAMDMTCKDKELVMSVSKDLNLDFSKWATSEPKAYRYF